MTQAPEEQEVWWWIVPLVWLCCGLSLPIVFWISNRKRSWRDWKRLGRATTLPPEHLPPEPRKVRDMTVGEKAYVDKYSIVTSKKGHRVYISWDATLQEAPQDPDDRFAPLQLQRLPRGFSLVIRASDRFGPRSLFWGEYAPVIELMQKEPQTEESPSARP